MKRFLSSLRFRLVLLVLLAIFPALGVVVYTASEQRALATVKTEQDALRVARVAASGYEQLVEGTRQLLIVLAQLPGVRDPDPVGCSAFLATLLEQYPRYSNFAVSDRNGNIFCSATPFNGPVNISDDDFIPHVIATRDFGAGEYRVGPISGKPVIGFGYPLFDQNGQPQAVVMTSFLISFLNQIAAESLMPAGSTLTIRDRSGTIVARYPDPEAWVGKTVADTPLLKLIKSQDLEGTAESVGLDGVPRLYAFTPVPGLPKSDLYVSVGIPTSVAYAEVNQALTRNVIALGVIGILALAAAWFGGDLFLLRHVNVLLRVTGRLADGDLSARTGARYGVGELSQLARAFDRMVDSLQQRETERRRAEEQIRRQASRAESLVTVAGRLNAQLDLDAVLNAICEETARALDAPAASVHLYDEKRDTLYHAAEYGFGTESAYMTRPFPRSAYDQLARRKDSIVALVDMPSSSLTTATGTPLGSHTVVSARMLREEQLIGVLNVLLSNDKRDISADDLTLLKGLAAQAGLAIANARLYEALRREEQARAGLLHQVISAQEDERLRIARELHDETSQSLSTLMVGLDMANLALPTDTAKASQHVRTTKFIAEGMLDNIHRLIEDLRPLHLDVLGLASAISWYGEQRLTPLGIAIHVDMDGLTDRLPSSMETVLFRIFQEAMTNVMRHAQASTVSVRLARQDGSVLLHVSDNGCGFDPTALGQGKGFGLRGMQERVAILGGEFRIQTHPGAGTAIDIRVPLSHKEKIDAENPGAPG